MNGFVWVRQMHSRNLGCLNDCPFYISLWLSNVYRLEVQYDYALLLAF